jgi:hypothetical protein
LDQQTKQEAIDNALKDPHLPLRDLPDTDARTSAAIAYVWGKHAARVFLYWDVNWDANPPGGKQEWVWEWVAQALMRNELTHPGMLAKAYSGQSPLDPPRDPAARAAIIAVAAKAVNGYNQHPGPEPERQPAAAPDGGEGSELPQPGLAPGPVTAAGNDDKSQPLRIPVTYNPEEAELIASMIGLNLPYEMMVHALEELRASRGGSPVRVDDLPDGIEPRPPTGRDQDGNYWDKRVVKLLVEIAILKGELDRRVDPYAPPPKAELLDKEKRVIDDVGAAAGPVKGRISSALEQLGILDEETQYKDFYVVPELVRTEKGAGYQFRVYRTNPVISGGPLGSLVDNMLIVDPSGRILDLNGTVKGPLQPDVRAVEALQTMKDDEIRQKITTLKRAVDNFYGLGTLPDTPVPKELTGQIALMGLVGEENNLIRQRVIDAAQGRAEGRRFTFHARPEVSQLVVLAWTPKETIDWGVIVTTSGTYPAFFNPDKP